MKTKIRDLKTELRILAATIRVLKERRPHYPNGYIALLADAQRTFRHKHVVRCLLRGRTLEQVENKHRTYVSFSGERKPERPLSETLLRNYWREVTGLEYPKMPPPPPKREVVVEEAACASPA